MKYWDLGMTWMSSCVAITGLGAICGLIWVKLFMNYFLHQSKGAILECTIDWSIGSFVTNSEKDNVLLSPTPPCMNNRLYHLPWIAGNPSPPKWRRRCVSMCVLCVVCEVREMHGLRGKGETDHLGWRKPTNGPIAVPISKDTRRGSNQVDPGYCAALLTPQK